MLAATSRVVDSIQQRKHRKRPRSFFFSSRKVLIRSRMTREKKISAKSGQASRGTIERALNFGSGSTVGEDDGGVCSIGGNQDAFGDVGSSQVEGMEDVEVNNVRFLDNHFCNFEIHSRWSVHSKDVLVSLYCPHKAYVI